MTGTGAGGNTRTFTPRSDSIGKTYVISLVLPSTTTGLASFQNFPNLGLVDIPESVVSMGTQTFNKMLSLHTVILRRTASRVDFGAQSFDTGNTGNRPFVLPVLHPDFEILVPETMLETYRTNGNDFWSWCFSWQINAIGSSPRPTITEQPVPGDNPLTIAATTTSGSLTYGSYRNRHRNSLQDFVTSINSIPKHLQKFIGKR